MFLYDASKVRQPNEIGEIGVPPALVTSIRLAGVRQRFAGFDRAPYLASFELIGTRLSVQLVNVYLFYGSPGRADLERRALETVAVARWTRRQRRSPNRGAKEGGEPPGSQVQICLAAARGKWASRAPREALQTWLCIYIFCARHECKGRLYAEQST